MTRHKGFKALVAALACLSMHGGPALAEVAGASPEAPTRTYGQNYKDMILAACIARAYKNDPTAAKDARVSAGQSHECRCRERLK